MKWIAVPILLLSVTTTLLADEIRGKVVSVADGDTVTVLDTEKVQHKIRLQGIDAPEKAQAFGTKSKERLSEKIGEKEVVVKWKEKDRYGRVLGEVYLGDRHINLEMVQDGLAWHYKQYSKSKELADAEDEARKAKKGLWVDNEPVPPWDYRKEEREKRGKSDASRIEQNRSYHITAFSPDARRHWLFVPQSPSLCSPARESPVLWRSLPARKPGKEPLSRKQLAPADLPKEAASFDLPIALGLLAASSQLASDILCDYAAIGELALDGSIRPAKGALSMALAAKEQGRKGFVVPAANAQEAAVVEGIEIIPVASLTEAVGFFSGQLDIPPQPFSWTDAVANFGRYGVDYSDVRGQESAKRAVTVAAAGAHHLLMLGSPGTGKTLLASRLGTILPELAPEESLQTTRIYSAVGRLQPGQPLMLQRPFRAPHHTISEAGLVGGGSTPTPGEISLAHNGVLFLDELPEYNRRTLEVLRQPLEDGRVTISRAMGSLTFPANLMLVAAMNPCPCGYHGDPRRECHCNPLQIERYMSRISGPLLDRLDIHIEVPPVPFRELSSEAAVGTNSESMKAQVVAAREIQKKRFGKGALRLNGRMLPSEIRKYCKLESDAESLLKNAMEEMGLSARAHDKILRIGRTIADLDAADNITAAHLSEAINYRTLDRSYWK